MEEQIEFWDTDLGGEYGGYEGALKYAGADVLAYASFGSWQGTWIAKVVYGGQVGYVTGYFGSCTHCDAWDGEFYGYGATATLSEWSDRLREFGERYLDPLSTYEEVMTEAQEQAEWDLDAQQMVEWLESVRDLGEKVAA